MRILALVVFASLVLWSSASADEVVLTDGRVVAGTVESLKLSGKPAYAGARIRAVRMANDRARIDSAWIEWLLRFALDRERRGVKSNGTVGVFVGRGVSAPSAIAVVRRLDALKRAPRLLFEADVTKKGLDGLDTIVVPGGWAPSQVAALGVRGRAALTAFVEGGGGFYGICAGGFLACSSVVWEGKRYAYPLGLVKGTAAGPVSGRAPWPTSEVFPLTLEGGRKQEALYAGGSAFDVKGAEVIARYPGGKPAVIRKSVGKGRVVLTGPHVEFDDRKDGDLLNYAGWAKGLKPGNARLFETFLRLLKPVR